MVPQIENLNETVPNCLAPKRLQNRNGLNVR